jgi:hypothetical protein
METNEAMDAAAAFMEEFPAENFDTTQALIAAAILWGENLGIRKMRVIATEALNDAHYRLFS